MAIVKTLIVKGVARFLTDAYMSTIRSGIWNGSTIQVGYGGTGVTSAKGDLYTPVFLSSSGITPCSVAIPHNTKDFKINGTTYSIFTTYTGTAPTIFAPTTLAGTGGYILATNAAKTGLEWVAKPATNVTTSAVVASSASGTTLITAAQSDPYYNLLEGGTVARSILFKHGDDLSISSNTDGIITFSLPTRLKALITSDTGTTIFNGFGRITSGGPFESFHTSAKDCMIVSTGYSSVWGSQLALDYRTNNIAYRAYNNGTWTDWALMASNKNVVNDNITVNWNAETTIATIAGIPIKIKIPANPDRRKAFYGTCTTASATAAKVVTISDTTGWELRAGTVIGVKFTNANTASNVTLAVNSEAAKSIFYNNAAYTGASADICGNAGRLTYYMYDGTYWVYIGNSYIINTSYSTMSLDEITTGTATSQRVMTAKIINDWLHTKPHTVSGIWTHREAVVFDTGTANEKGICFDINRNVSGGGQWAYQFLNLRDASDDIFFRVGVYGDQTTFNYAFLGTGEYNSTANFRIYPDKVTYGANLIAHAGNISNDNITVSWNTETTIATIAGVPIKIKIPANPNTWRSIRVNNGSSDSVGTGTGTKSMNFTATGNLSVAYLAAGTGTGQSGSADYFTIQIKAAANAVGVAGYVAAPTKAANPNQVWMTNADGVPAWRNATASAVLADAANSMTQLTAEQANPFYNLLFGGSVVRSIQFVAGEGMTVGTTDGSDVKITNVAPVYYVKGNADDTAGTWTGTDPRISAYYEGLTVIFVPQVAGASTTTLNINGLGAKTCYFTNTSKLTTNYAIGTPIILTYYADTWRRADYDSNTWRNIYTGGTSRVGTNTNTKAMNFASSNLNINYLAAGTNSGESGNTKYFTIDIDAKDWTGATSSAAGTAGYMPGAAAADRTKFLRGDGSWVALSLTDHTHSVKINGSTKTIAAPGGDAVDLGSYLPLSGGTLTGPLGKSNNYLIKPVADFKGSSGTYTGCITITLPAGIANTMVSMWIDVFNWSINKSFSVHCGGYTYNDSTWQHAPFALVLGARHRVRFGHNGTNFVIYIGEIDSTWSYPQVAVHNVILGHSPNYANWYKNWTISFETSVSNVTADITRYAIKSDDISDKSATIGTSLTTIATIGGTDIKAKIPNVTTQAIELVSVSKTLAVSTWTDMAAVSTYSGTYAIQISDGTLYASGTFSVCGGTDAIVDEIPLHVSSTGATWRPYARISAGQLQMTTNEATGTARTYTIKILKLI